MSGYKKYMKKDARRDNPFIKIFVISFFGMLLLFTLFFNYVSKIAPVDTSIGDYKEQPDDDGDKKIIDLNKLERIQSEDQGRNFTDLMQKPTDEPAQTQDNYYSSPADFGPDTTSSTPSTSNNTTTPKQDTVYKVFIGSYTSAEQAKVARDIIQESDSSLSPIVKCIGTNDYTLQVGIFKNKQSAESMLLSIQKNNLPVRIVQE